MNPANGLFVGKDDPMLFSFRLAEMSVRIEGVAGVAVALKVA